MLPRFVIFRLRQRSLVRGLVLALGAFAVSLALAGFPRVESLHSSRWQALAAPAIFWGMLETFRCLNPRWNLYHAGVLLLLYAELMMLVMVLFLAFFL